VTRLLLEIRFHQCGPQIARLQCAGAYGPLDSTLSTLSSSTLAPETSTFDANSAATSWEVAACHRRATNEPRLRPAGQVRAAARRRSPLATTSHSAQAHGHLVDGALDGKVALLEIVDPRIDEPAMPRVHVEVQCVTAAGLPQRFARIFASVSSAHT